MKVGFIGLGHMGAAMAARLIQAGHEVSVFNRSADKAQPLLALGAHPARKVADTCRGQAVITMLADDHAVSDTVFGDGGLISALSPGAIHVSMSTISVDLSRRLAAAHAQAQQRYLAAPVFGRPEAAAAGKLFVIAAGEAAAIGECKPLFDAIGQRTVPVSTEPSAANLVKLSGNFLIATVIEALGEAIALVRKGGVNGHDYVELLSTTLFPAPSYRIYGELIAARKFQPAGFAAPLGHKDIRLTLQAAETLRVPMPIASLINDRLLRLLARGDDKLDWSAMGGLASEDAGSG